MFAYTIHVAFTLSPTCRCDRLAAISSIPLLPSKLLSPERSSNSRESYSSSLSHLSVSNCAFKSVSSLITWKNVTAPFTLSEITTM